MTESTTNAVENETTTTAATQVQSWPEAEITKDLDAESYADYLGCSVKVFDSSMILLGFSRWGGSLPDIDGDKRGMVVWAVDAELRRDPTEIWLQDVAAPLEPAKILSDAQRAAFYRLARIADSHRAAAQLSQRTAIQRQNKIDAIVERMHEEAENRGWCEDFDDICEELDLPRRSRDYTVRTRVTVELMIDIPNVNATSEDGAITNVDHGLDDVVDTDWLREAIVDELRSGGFEDISLDAREAEAQ